MRTYRRIKAAAIHLIVCLFVMAIVAAVVFEAWFPAPFFGIAGGTALLLILIVVDVVCGPLLTALVASPDKSMQTLRRDLTVIAFVQIAALGYGLYALSLARPVLMAFEIDRFRIVSAADVDPSLLGDAPLELRELSWSGPRLIAAVKPTDPAEILKSVELAFAGYELSLIPRNWRPYESRREAVWKAARPVSTLLEKYPDQSIAVQRISLKCGQPLESLRFLPVLSRHESWVAVLAPTSVAPVDFLPVEGFF
jgi:hypothetical protein